MKNKIFVTVSFTLLFALFLLLFSGKILFMKQIEDYERNANPVSVDWISMFPYNKTIEIYAPHITESQEISNNSGIWDRYNQTITKLGNLGNAWSKSVFHYKEISLLGTIFTSKLTDPGAGNSYIMLENGYWTNASSEKMSSLSAQNCMSPYYNLQKYLEGNGIPFLYFQTPVKECRLDNQLPFGVSSYANDTIDTYLAAADEFGVHYVDLRKKLHNDGLDHYSMFYKTDHHWKIEAGIWATSVIEETLNHDLGFSIIDVNQFGSFTPKVYKNAMFGSAGQALTHSVEDSEDFSIPFPDFTTSFRLEVPNRGLDQTGTFEDLFINYAELQNIIKNGGGYAYEVMLYGNTPYEKITNYNLPDGPKILMIRDSFSIAAAPYLALSCSELVLLDTRSEFTGSVINCIDTFQPDAVLVLQSYPQVFELNQ